MKFDKYQIPVAYSMIALTKLAILEDVRPFTNFICYWTAFNNIYVTIADIKGQRVKQRFRGGKPVNRNFAGVTIPEVDVLTQIRQIQMALEEFSNELKHDLVIHPSTKFFVERVPSWGGIKIEYDLSGQRLNGVINVGKTFDSTHPIWSPIDTKLYKHYFQQPSDVDARYALCDQIVKILYTIRNNTVHGGKRADDSNDRKVIKFAFPLLKMIVEHFLQEAV